MIKLILLGALYVGALVAFRKLGGLRAAADAITAWGQSSAAERRKKIESLFK